MLRRRRKYFRFFFCRDRMLSVELEVAGLVISRAVLVSEPLTCQTDFLRVGPQWGNESRHAHPNWLRSHQMQRSKSKS
jgi:hypothetical protein